MAQDRATSEDRQQETRRDEVDDETISDVIRDIVEKNDPYDERVVCYAQPIFDTHTESYRQAEVLMRLKIGNEIVGPNRFIPMAEKNGSIFRLTYILLNKVCSAMKELSKKCDFDRITVNFPPVFFCNEDMLKNLCNIMKMHGTDTNKLGVELTEQALEDRDDVKNRVSSMTNAGIKLYLDDFGTGYSSMARIVTYPFSVIKIDKGLLDTAMKYQCMEELISIIIRVLKKNGYEILMEGVEDENGKKFSMDTKVDYIQGFLYERPVPLEKLENYFAPATT